MWGRPWQDPEFFSRTILYQQPQSIFDVLQEVQLFVFGQHVLKCFTLLVPSSGYFGFLFGWSLEKAILRCFGGGPIVLALVYLIQAAHRRNCRSYQLCIGEVDEEFRLRTAIAVTEAMGCDCPLQLVISCKLYSYRGETEDKDACPAEKTSKLWWVEQRVSARGDAVPEI